MDRNKRERRKKKDKDRRSKRTKQKNKEEIGKGNQMTALRFQTGEHIRHPWPPFGIVAG